MTRNKIVRLYVANGNLGSWQNSAELSDHSVRSFRWGVAYHLGLGFRRWLTGGPKLAITKQLLLLTRFIDEYVLKDDLYSRVVDSRYSNLLTIGCNRMAVAPFVWPNASWATIEGIDTRKCWLRNSSLSTTFIGSVGMVHLLDNIHKGRGRMDRWLGWWSLSHSLWFEVWFGTCVWLLYLFCCDFQDWYGTDFILKLKNSFQWTQRPWWKRQLQRGVREVSRE